MRCSGPSQGWSEPFSVLNPIPHPCLDFLSLLHCAGQTAAVVAQEKAKEAQEMYEKEMAERERNRGRKIGAYEKLRKAKEGGVLGQMKSAMCTVA
jgi:hypothetical protein